MKRLILIVFLLPAAFAETAKAIEHHLTAFCYHDVSQEVSGKLYHDPNAINTQYLAHHFQWLKDNGYVVVSNHTIEQARAGLIQLPAKATSLSFDDGYESIYYHVFPLLQAYNYPATIGIVTSWIENQASNSHDFEVKFLNWQQIKEMSKSPLIEVASHSHDLHHGIIANPQNNTQPAATSRVFSHDSGYETDEAYHHRIKSDLAQSRRLIHAHTNQYPTTLIWPYGSYSEKAWEIAKTLGFKTSMTLEQGHNKTVANEHISRYLVSENPATHEFKRFFNEPSYQQPQRVVHVDLDYVFDPDSEQQEKNLDQLIERIKTMSINTVFLQAFADADGDGNADALYFNNAVMPVKSDLFNRVAWQLKTRSAVTVYAWMPVSAFILPDNKGHDWQVKSWQNGMINNSKEHYQRLSIFHPQAQAAIKDIYRALATYNNFSGILFHDDALLTDYEDFSPFALKYYSAHGLNFDNPEELISNTENKNHWAQIKTQAIINFTHELTLLVKHYRPGIKTARNLYAQPILNPQAEQWFAQNLQRFVEHYDFTAIMAMPYLEQAKSPTKWFKKLLLTVADSEVDKTKLLFELQTKDWSTASNINTETLVWQIHKLKQFGFLNYGYYPDDFINDHPKLQTITPHMSLNDFPYEKR